MRCYCSVFLWDRSVSFRYDGRRLASCVGERLFCAGRLFALQRAAGVLKVPNGD